MLFAWGIAFSQMLPV